MPDRRPQVKFPLGGDPKAVTLLDPSCFTQGTQKDDPTQGWYLWGCSHQPDKNSIEEDHVFFADDELQGILESLSDMKGRPLLIQKKPKGTYKVWTNDGDVTPANPGGWEEVPQTKPAMPPQVAADTAQQSPQENPLAPPGPVPPPKQPEGPQEAAQSASGESPGILLAPVSSKGVSIADMATVYGDILKKVWAMLYDVPMEPPSNNAEQFDLWLRQLEQARQISTSIFISVTGGRSELPKDFNAAPVQFTPVGRRSRSDEEASSEPPEGPPPLGERIPASEFVGEDGEDQLPF